MGWEWPQVDVAQALSEQHTSVWDRNRSGNGVRIVRLDDCVCAYIPTRNQAAKHAQGLGRLM